jgi:hypothetical protein
LNGWFKLTVAGRYRFVVRFNREKGAFADGESNEVTFTLSARQ